LVPALALVAAAVVFRGAKPPAEALAQAPVKNTSKGAASGSSRTGAAPGTPARPVAGPAAPQRSSLGSATIPASAEPRSSRVSFGGMATKQQQVVAELAEARRWRPKSWQHHKLRTPCRPGPITEKDVTGEIDRIAGKFGLRDRWLRYSAKSGIPGQYRREVVGRLALRKASALMCRCRRKK
jgi:hypothetical protein